MDEIYLDKKDFQFLFAGGDMLTFMDMESYEQIELAADFVGDQAQFLPDGMKMLVQLYEGRPICIKLPVQVTLTVAEADPVLRGGTAAPSYKSAVLENGLKIQVPPFIGAGEKIIVATEDGSYVRRAEADGLSLPRPERDDRRRPQGRPAADPRFRRTGKSPGLDEGPGRFRHQPPTSAPKAS